ncbi:hypothetical protein [Plantactinospora endophytica]|uniref:Sortase n=1 Tax=Plantactinospora endophytica TaxID=673535 RepID=A0ABQ4E410_9ACTN|nr:hypothetical protein [Plantactinospora endophytica]GIG89057.1 hypothetical protein Pen02_39930 [Plantactinospora endophytica]
MAVPGRPGDRSFLVPIVALGSTLVALVVATALVLVLRNDESADPTGTGPTRSAPTTGASSAGSTPGGGPVAAECLVGTWRVTSHQEQVDVPEVGRLNFTGGIGSTLTLGADGVGIADYGDGTLYTSSHAGQEVALELRGRVDYRYVPAGDRIELRDVRSAAEVRLRVGEAGTPGRWRPFTASTAPANYTCAGDLLTQRSLVVTTSYERSR